MRGCPVVGKVFKELQAEIWSGRVKGQNVTASAIGLVPDRIAGRQRNGSGIGKAAHPIQSAEVMIKRAVLLHQDDDVFDVRDAAMVVVRRDRKGLGNTLRKSGSERGAA